jgi:hypothetical protein
MSKGKKDKTKIENKVKFLLSFRTLAHQRTAKNSWLKAGWQRKINEWKKHNGDGEGGGEYLEQPGER